MGEHPTAMAPGPGGRFRTDPDPSLRPFVVEYWAMTRDLAALGGFAITPDCFGELICCAGDVFAVEEGGTVKLPPCFLIGLLDRPLRIASAGVIRCMGARLHAWTVGQVSAAGRGGSLFRWADAEGLLGPRLDRALEMAGRCDWPDLAGVLDEALIAEAGGWEPGPAGRELAGQFARGGARPTGIVAAERGITGRQVERRVRRLTRTSPKRLSCLARFQEARDAIWADPGVDLARLAVAAGFSDQPHMTREFRRYSGQTPARFARDSAAKKRWLSALDVAIVQERDPGGR